MAWEIDGVVGHGEAPALAGRKRGRRLLILGPAPCLFDDLKALGALSSDVGPDETMSVNFSWLAAPWPIEHMCSLEAAVLPHFKALARHIAGNPRLPIVTHGGHPGDPADVVWHIEQQRGTSGLFAIFIGIAMGFSKIVAAGLPLDSSGHFFDTPETRRWGDYDRLPPASVSVWRAAAERWPDRVRSLSGRTADWFGRPDAAWWAG